MFFGKILVIGSNSLLESNVHLGEYAEIGSNVVVKERAVIEKYAEVNDNLEVEEAAVVIRTPTSSSLYSSCAPFDRVNQSDVELAENAHQSESLSAELNDRVQELINNQFAQFHTHSIGRSNDVLQLIKSMYLMAFDGIEKFKENENKFSGGKGKLVNFGGFNFSSRGSVTFGGKRFVPESNDFDDCKHFIGQSQKNILTDEVRDSLIKLIATDIDSRREHRSNSENFIEFMEKIQNEERKVYLDSLLIAN